MEEKKKHKVMIGIEVILLGMILAIVGTNAVSSNPPSNGVSYSKNSQTTVEGALNDLYNKANYGNASAGQILSGKTALVGGSKVTGTMPDRGLAQNGSWGCGEAGCGSGNDAYYAINALPEGYYHSDGNTWAPEARISANTLRSSLGITANKILKGQSIAGVAGTGETSCPDCSSIFENKRFAGSTTKNIQLSQTKRNIDGYNDITPNNWTSWRKLAEAGGTWTVSEDKDVDTTWETEAEWHVPIDDKFYQATKVIITLYNYDGTDASLAKSGDTDFYTQVRYGSTMSCTGGYASECKNVESYIGILPQITIYKKANNWKILDVKSNIDWYRTQNKMIFDTTKSVLTDRSTDWIASFNVSVIDNNSLLSINYWNWKEEKNQEYTGVKSFTLDKNGYSSAEEKFVESGEFQNYNFFGMNNVGTRSYYYKKAGKNKSVQSTGDLVLRARYNYWSVVLNYYK